jgi:glucose/arabinose dehydrogenase
MIVLEKKGRLVRFIQKGDGTYQNMGVMADIPVRSNSELGLLGMAFHPEYKKNGRIYIYSTPKDGVMRGEVSEWMIKDQNSWSIERVRTVLEIPQPYGNHNGGQLQFGTDGCLYISLGDGGWRDDPHQNGQNPKSLLGSIIRIRPTVGGDSPYEIPLDNPFVGKEGYDERVFVYGLRNPWRFSFARDGQLIVADVGQNLYEEVSLAKSGDNLGWNTFEGVHCFEGRVGACTQENHRAPIWEYTHDQGTSITGGYILEDSSSLSGSYVVGDFTSGRVWALSMNGEAQEIGVFPILISTFGRDTKGQVYLADFAKGDVYILREGE